MDKLVALEQGKEPEGRRKTKTKNLDTDKERRPYLLEEPPPGSAVMQCVGESGRNRCGRYNKSSGLDHKHQAKLKLHFRT